MNESDLRKWGLQSINEKELTISGGLNWKKLFEVLDKALDLLEKAEKYWPDFKKGFKKGWEAA